MLWGGFLEASGDPMAVAGITSLGYPAYFATMLGIAKLLGVIGIWQNKVRFLKSWAYAGFTFDTLFATISILASGLAFSFALVPVVGMIIVIVSFTAAKKLSKV